MPVEPLFHLRHPAVQSMNGRYTTRQYDTRVGVTRSQSPDWWCVQVWTSRSSRGPWYRVRYRQCPAVAPGIRLQNTDGNRRPFQSSVAVSNGQPAQPLQLTRHRERYCDKWTTVLCTGLHRPLADVCMLDLRLDREHCAVSQNYTTLRTLYFCELTMPLDFNPFVPTAP